MLILLLLLLAAALGFIGLGLCLTSKFNMLQGNIILKWWEWENKKWKWWSWEIYKNNNNNLQLKSMRKKQVERKLSSVKVNAGKRINKWPQNLLVSFLWDLMIIWGHGHNWTNFIHNTLLLHIRNGNYTQREELEIIEPQSQSTKRINITPYIWPVLKFCGLICK